MKFTAPPSTRRLPDGKRKPTAALTPPPQLELDGLLSPWTPHEAKPQSEPKPKPVSAIKPAATAGADWPPDVAENAAFVLTLSLADLPATPFCLRPGVTVVDAAKFLRSLKADVALGPSSPRSLYGALQDDLARLRAMVGQRVALDAPPEFLLQTLASAKGPGSTEWLPAAKDRQRSLQSV